MFANSPFVTIIRSGRLVVFRKKVLLQISQNSLEKTCPRISLLMKLQIYSVYLYQKKKDSSRESWQIFFHFHFMINFIFILIFHFLSFPIFLVQFYFLVILFLLFLFSNFSESSFFFSFVHLFSFPFIAFFERKPKENRVTESWYSV